MRLPPVLEAALKTSVGLAAGVACMSGLTTHQKIGQTFNAVTLGFGVWEISRLASLRGKGAFASKALVWSLLAVKMAEQGLMTIFTLYPPTNAVTMDRPQFFVYNWGMIFCFVFTYILQNLYTSVQKWRVNQSHTSFSLSLATSALLILLAYQSHAHAKIIHITTRQNPEYRRPLVPPPKFEIWREVKPTATLVPDVPTVAAADVDLNLSPIFHRPNVTAAPISKPTSTIPTFHYEIDEEELARQTAWEEAHPEIVSETLSDEYTAYNSGGASGSLDSTNFRYYNHYWMKSWDMALPADAVFAFLVYWTVGFLRSDATAGAAQPGVARVRRSAYIMVALQLALWYITSTAMIIGYPKNTLFKLVAAFEYLADLIPKAVYQNYLRPRVAFLLLVVCWTTRTIVFDEVERDVAKEEWEAAVAKEVKRAAEEARAVAASSASAT